MAGPQRASIGTFYIALDGIAGGALLLVFPAALVAERGWFPPLVVGVVGFLLLWAIMLVCGLARGGTAVAIGGAGAVRGVTLRSTLQQRSYDWLTGDEARRLWELCGEQAFKLPPWEEVGILPGVSAGDLGSLKAVLRLRQETMTRR